MEPMRLIDFLLAAVSAGLGWWGKIVWESVKELRRDLRDLENGIPREYVRKSDWDRATDRISEEIRALREDIGSQMGRIFEKLDGKADKGRDWQGD